MREWELYPLIVRSNSEECILGIPWGDIPRDRDFAREAPYDNHCDYRIVEEGGKRVLGCNVRCGVDNGILKEYGV